MMERIVPHDENELAKRMAIRVDEESLNLTAMKEELKEFENFAENVSYLDCDMIDLLKRAYKDKIDNLSEMIQEMKDMQSGRVEAAGKKWDKITERNVTVFRRKINA